MYASIRPLLFRLDPETAHGVTLAALDLMHQLKMSRMLVSERVEAPVDLMGLRFPNRIGLAAGLDKNADHLDALGALGFGFVEVGTVTPKAQPGNPGPRLFRLPEREALINRMGFNNAGVEHLVANVRKSQFKGIIGVNIGKNLTTSVERAVDDYLVCLKAVHEVAHYVTVNISSPNTPGLRNLQFGEHLDALLGALKEETLRLDARHGRHVPLAVKIAPDMTPQEIESVAGSLQKNAIDAVIATNTTINRDAVKGLNHCDEAGGLSGAPVRDSASQVIMTLRECLPAMPIIGVGGVMKAEHAEEKRKAGADLVQLYSGLIYHGPQLIADCARVLSSRDG
ncbi:quinone-dependent dihydroorotate dehydrogenase [Phytohalomonas tamaricis]|uniref:quinone-dependent dihydroorotate dehydrogenase n=1 Tax=Phytohalomonas tamaricis TaxID=2081032 RepID=UPI000D0B2D7A|nr:quinone-dependent dihydroorotate dehydrogenase [Phytohalomonas tamaricis]